VTTTVTCTYDSADKVHNAREDLVATGIPQEEILVNEKTHQIKVISPDVTKPEIVEILSRHEPSDIH